MKFKHTVTSLPLENEYPKLIRDKIPAIIKARGGHPNTRTLQSDSEYLQYLLKKLTEESQEAASATTDSNLVEEIADIREVIDAILQLKNVTREDLKQVQDEKRMQRGGFELRLLMLDND